MATIGIDSPAGNVDARTEAAAILRRPMFPAIRWGAVIAGVAVGTSLQLALTLLGIATGLSTLDITQGEVPGTTGPLLWALLSMLISGFVGGYVAARMSGLKRRMDGILHGAVSWAVTMLLFSMLATSVGGSLASGVFSMMAPNAAGRAAGTDSAIGGFLRGQLGRNADPAAFQRLQQQIEAGQRDQAVRTVSSMGIDPSRAATIVDQALIISGSPERASPQSRAAAENAVRTAGAAAWMAFLAVMLSLLVGVIGGLLGAAGSRRVTWAGATPAASS